MAEQLHLHPAQRVLSRAVYAEEYAASIRECFVETPAQQQAMLASHDAMISAGMANAAFARMVEAARARKPPPPPPEEEDASAAPPQGRLAGGAADGATHDGGEAGLASSARLCEA